MSRLRVLPNRGAKACRCGESRPEAMTRSGCSPCYECMLSGLCRERTEGHHPFGRNDPAFANTVVEVPGNWHRVLDAARARRPEILKRPGDNPLHQMAAVVETLGEAADALADFARREEWPEWVAALADLFASAAANAADWLLILAGKLDERFGPAWAEDLDMPPWHL
jgi:hypothetical protein